MTRKNEHDEHCRAIAERLDAIVNGELYHDEHGDEWTVEYEPAYGYEMYVAHTWIKDGDDVRKVRVTLTTKDGETYTKSDDGETVDDIDEYLHQVDLWDYLEGSIYNLEYRVPGRYDDPTSVQVMIACGGPNIYIDTKSGDVELYWWGESGRYPMRRETVDAIDEYMCELYNC